MRPTNNRRANIRGGREGIALVMVLGFLAVLVIMGLGFAVSMRVERLVARYSLDHIKAKQLGEAALVRALEEIDYSVFTNMVPDWRSADWIGGVYVTTSGSAVVGVSNLFVGHVTNYVPNTFYQRVEAAAASARWLPFSYRQPGGTVTVGRYAYIAIDCSGLLDINFDHSETNYTSLPRDYGESVYEYRLRRSLLPEISDANWQNLILCRVPTAPQSIEKPWLRIETFAEISPLLSRGFNNQQPLSPANVRSSSFIPYSRYPAGFWNGSAVQIPTVLPRDSSAILSNRSSLIASLVSAGISDAQGFINNLIDYTDADSRPYDLDSFCTEAVPLINEVVVTNEISADPSGVFRTNQYRISAEVWYPFTTTNTSSYSLRIRALYSNAVPSQFNCRVINEEIPLPGGLWTNGRVEFVTTAPIAPTSIVDSNGIANVSNAYVIAQVTLFKTSPSPREEHDRVGVTLPGNPFKDWMRLSVPPIPAHSFNRTFTLVRAANDPRLNWRGSDDVQWRPYTSASSVTLGRTNNALTLSAPDSDGHSLMYVADRPLKTVGELGLLLHDPSLHWQTVRLLEGANHKAILDHFVLDQISVRHGLVNPNSYHTGVVATVFNGMRVDRVPNDPATVTLNESQAQLLAQHLVTNAVSFINLSDLKFMGRFVSNYPVLNAATPAVFHESYVRNSSGLFSPRQQLYTIILAAEVLQTNTTNINVVAQQRGVGLVWRDPYQNSGGNNEVRVRNFRWLTD